MGLLDSLASILPYAIPAAAGAALGGPGLGMVGAGGAAAAKAGALDQQMKLAELMNESDYRNKELGLRQQEIESNEALRKQQAAAEQQYRSEMLDERDVARKDTEADRAAQRAQAQQFHEDTHNFQMWMGGFQQQMAGEHEQDKRRQMQQDAQGKISSQIERTESILKQGAKASWAAQGFATKHMPESMGGGNYDDFEQKYVERNLPSLLGKAGVTPQQMKAAGFDDATIGETFPDYGKPAAPAATPSDKLKAAGKGAPAPAATFKTSQPDTPPGHAYHLNGKAYTVKGGVATEVPNG